MSASSTSERFPKLIIFDKPNTSALSNILIPMVPLCEKNATGPSFERTILSCPWNAQSSLFAALNIPIQLGPITRILCLIDNAFTSASIAALSPPSSLPPPETITTLWIPFLAQVFII